MLTFQTDTDEQGKRRVICDVCGAKWHTHWPLENIHHHCSSNATGPGTALKSILAELGIKPTASCGCEAFASRMNIWGPEGCLEHREEIETHLRAAYDSADLATKLRAGVNAIAQGKPLTLAGLLDLAIQRGSESNPSTP